MNELKPCPFCGGEATLVEDIYNDQINNYVICVNDDCNANTGRCDTEDEAITKWNNRTSPWHTGTPTEEGVYVVVVKKYLVTENNRRVFLVEKAPSGFFLKDDRQGYLEDSDILAWIEPYKEENNG